MSRQAPHLERGEMTAAENANIRAAEHIMRLLAKALREHADQYPPKLRKALSDPKAETNIEVSFNGKSVYSATLDKDQKHKEPPVNRMDETQALFLKEALSKQKGESLDSPDIKNMRVFVNGEKLFELKEGKVIQNDLPLEFSKTLSDMMGPKPLDLAIDNFTQKMQEATAHPLPQVEEAQQKPLEKPAPTAKPQPVQQAESSAPAQPSTEPTRSQATASTPTATTPSESAQQSETATATKAPATSAATQSAPSTAAQPKQSVAQSQAAKTEMSRAEPVKTSQQSTQKSNPDICANYNDASHRSQLLSRSEGVCESEHSVSERRTNSTAAKVELTPTTNASYQVVAGEYLVPKEGYKFNPMSFDTFNALYDVPENFSPDKYPTAQSLHLAAPAKVALGENGAYHLVEKGRFVEPQLSEKKDIGLSPSPTKEPDLGVTKTIPGLDRSLNNGEWVPAAHQDELNRKVITHAKAALEVGCSEQPRGNRQLDCQKYTISETPDSLSVHLKDTNTTVEKKGETITGQSRQTDVDALRKGNIAMGRLDPELSSSSEMEMGD
jgi:hypothetical protein